jgi:hypothetical protein
LVKTFSALSKSGEFWSKLFQPCQNLASFGQVVADSARNDGENVRKAGGTRVSKSSTTFRSGGSHVWNPERPSAQAEAMIVDDRHAFTDQAVEQSAFSYVGPANERYDGFCHNSFYHEGHEGH